MRYFCTYFDHRYLSKGLALYQSLKKHSPSFGLWVLCMDQECHALLCRLNLPGLHPIALADFEAGDEELARAKENRTAIEYYFTCTPSLVLFLLKNVPEADILTYLDADLYFFADPAPVFAEMGDDSTSIIEHRFPPHLRDRLIYGIYNVGWVSFRRDERALACLHWWRQRCNESCADEVTTGRFADQKYLDDWPARFPGVVVLRHKGANLAPWNLSNYKITQDVHGLWVDDQPLIFFHFHGLKPVNGFFYRLDLQLYKVKVTRILRQSIYAPYIQNLCDVGLEIVPLLQQLPPRRNTREEAKAAHTRQTVSLPRRAGRWGMEWLNLARRIIARDYIAVPKRRVL